MKEFRWTEELVLAKIQEGGRARRVGPKPPIREEDIAMQAALDGQECFPTNAPPPPRRTWREIVASWRGNESNQP